MNLEEIVQEKNVLFITTKNVDYIRNSQEIHFLEQHAKKVNIVYSDKKGYARRLPDIYLQLMRFPLSKVDVIFAGFAPQLLLPFFGKWKKKLVIIDFFISVYDTLVNDRQKFKNNSLPAKFCHFLDQKTLENMNLVIVDTKADGKYFLREFVRTDRKMQPETMVWYLEADKTIYCQREQKKPLALRDRYVVLYFGSILPLQGVEVVLEALKEFVEDSQIYFQIIGPIPKSYMKVKASNIEYIDWLPQQELAEYIANADLCLAGHFHGTIEKARRTIPGKAYIYEAMGKSMILGDNEANHELFVLDEKHDFVKMGDSKNLAEVIRKHKEAYLASIE